jgi:peptidoglycan/LPS O-acetylase OafA/YrhL
MNTAAWRPLSSCSAIDATADEYRADIDGLRALAVLAVVAFHAFPSLLPGGFVGVDIFFVISGYLISGIILEGLARGRFSFLQFYCRRIRRIFPALIVVLLVCWLIGWTSLLAEEFRQLGSHIVAGAIFVSDFKYWYEAGYFDMAGELKPLLHLWSLAVEEQFYILWPFLLWAVWKLRASVLWFVACVALASFALNIVYVERGTLDAAFYSPAARFWELMLGAMLAAALNWQRGHSPFRCNAISAIGLLAICSALLLIARDARFPGWWALLPTVGTVLLIAAPGAWFNRTILSHPWLVAIGLISYPLYLWHWPLLSFARIFEGQTPTVAVRLAAVAVSVALAWATYRLVERPIRFGKALGGRFKTAAALSVAMVALAGAGYAARAGVPRSIAPQIIVNNGEISSERGHEIFFKYQLDHNFLCTPERFRKWAVKQFAPARCVQSKNIDKKDIAIIGDSHAEDLFIGLAERLPDANIVTYIQGLPIRSNGIFNDAFDYVESDKNIRVVIMTAWWDYHKKHLPPGRDLQTELTKTVGELVRAGKVVYLLDDRPAFPFYPDVCKYVRRRFFWQARRGTHCEFERSLYEAQRSQYLPALRAVAKQLPNVHLLDTSRTFCDDRFCRMGRDGKLFYRDQNHLTIAGSRAVAADIARQIVLPDAAIKQPQRSE